MSAKLSIALSLLLTFLGSFAHAQLPGVGDATGVPAPDWVRPGTRLTYYASSAITRGSSEQLVAAMGKNGAGFQDPRTGKYFNSVEVPTASGEGYTQVNVAHLDANNVALDIRCYNMDRAAGGLSLFNFMSYVGAPATGSDFWIHPQLLAGMKEQEEGGLIIKRMPYTLDGRTYNALRIQTQTQGAMSQATYDLASGVLLICGTATTGANVATVSQTGRVGTGAGSTTLTQTKLINVRQVNVPGIGGTVPNILQTARALDFSGQITTAVNGCPSISFPFVLRFQATRSGSPSCVEMKQTTEIRDPSGLPSMPNEMQRCFGAQAGTLWITPGVLAQLRAGTVFDDDPITRVRFAVAQVDAAHVTLSETGPSQSQTYQYDLRTGLLVGITQSDRIPTGTTTISVGLTSIH